MILLVLTVVLYLVVAAMLALAAIRRDGSMGLALRQSVSEFLHLLPRLAIGVLGSGFLARALPQEMIVAWLGPDTGIFGVTLAAIAGGLTPGGPVVGYALGSAALKSGAGLPQVMAYVTGWSLYTVNRMLIWEIPTMPVSVVRQRILVSLPLPFAIAGLTWLVTRAG